MLKVEGLNQYYGGSHILRDLSFGVERGKITALLGRNGVGKTTLLKCLMGLIPAKDGQIHFNALDITLKPTHWRARMGIGYVPQGRDIFPRLTVEENLLMGLAARPSQNKLPPLIFQLFPILKTMLKRRGGDLSGGQQQQLAIGRALAMQPSLLMLDEPTEGIQPSIIKDIGRAIRVVAKRQETMDKSMDNESREVIKNALSTVAQKGEVGVLLIEQYYDFAQELADDYLLMERGEVIKRGRGVDMEKDGVRALLAV